MAFTNIVDIIYPIGTVYISFSSTSPATLFGETWASLPANKYLRSGNNINTGGSNLHYHTLDISECRAAIGAVNDDIGSLGYYAAEPIEQFTSTGAYSFSGMPNPSNSKKCFNHHIPVYGETYATTVEPEYQNCFIWKRTT